MPTHCAPVRGPAALAALLLAALTATATAAQDVAHPADVSVSGTLSVEGGAALPDGTCIGATCALVDALPAPDTALVIAGPQPRLYFEDHTTGAQASDDWSIVVNERAPGFMNLFSIRNETTGRTPFTIESIAPDNALWINSNGDVGLNTSLPRADLHLASSHGPVFRIENTSYATAWDLIANSGGLIFRNDKLSQTPMILYSDATNDRLTIRGDRVGIGRVPTEGVLHIASDSDPHGVVIEDRGITGARGLLHLRNKGPVFFALEDKTRAAGDNSGRVWNFQNQSGEFRITTAPGGPGEIEMRMTPGGDMYIKGEIYTGTGGTSPTCAAGCDRVFDPGYDLPPIARHTAEMLALGHLPAVGPTPESGPFNLSTMTGGMLNELEKAHLYIGRLDRRNAALRGRVAALESRLDEIEAHLSPD